MSPCHVLLRHPPSSAKNYVGVRLFYIGKHRCLVELFIDCKLKIWLVHFRQLRADALDSGVRSRPEIGGSIVHKVDDAQSHGEGFRGSTP